MLRKAGTDGQMDGRTRGRGSLERKGDAWGIDLVRKASR